MNLTIPAKYKDWNMSNWEKIFVANFYVNNRQIPNKTAEKSRVDLIREDINRSLQELYELPEDHFKIDSHCAEVEREYNSNIQALKARGENIDPLVTQNKEKKLKFIAEEHSKKNYQQYEHIVEIVKNELYDSAFKYLMLNEALTKIYKKEPDKNGKMQTIVKKRDINKSTEGLMILNRSTMNYINDFVENNKDGKALKDNDGMPISFNKLYFDATDNYKETVSKKNTISLDEIETYGKGHWIKFEGKASNPDGYMKNANALSSLVQGTPWCTKTLAFQQLEEGDFFVFVDNEHNQPHVAVKMLGDQLDEVRGIKGGDAQELEENYRDVTISFLEKNKDIKNGLEWLEKEEWNQRLVNYGKKLEAKEFTTEDVEQLIQDLFFRSDYKNHTGHVNTNLARLRSKLYMGRKQFAEYFECKENEIFCGDLFVDNSGRQEFWMGDPYFFDNINKELKIVLGNAHFTRNTSIENLIAIYGKAIFTECDDLPVIKNIYASGAGLSDSGGYVVEFWRCNLNNLKNLQQFDGKILFESSNIDTLENPCLTRIGFNRSSTKSFGNTCKLDSLYIDGSKIEDFGNLFSVDDLDINGICEIYNLGKIEEIKRLSISGVNHIHNFINLKKVDTLKISGENSMTSLGSLQNANSIELYSDSVKDSGDLTYVDVLQLRDNIKASGNIKRIKTLDLSQTDGIIDLSGMEYLGEVIFPVDRDNDSPIDIIHGSTTIKVEGNPQQMEAVKARINRHREIKAENEKKQKDAEMSWNNVYEDLIDPNLIGQITLSEQENTKVKQRIADWIASAVRNFKELIGR